ncbi:MAG: hypothetical protein D6687_02925 [Acidobacteria bacterium]|nr:MAG: hypothetical protein D6687_02925 [Acidobacteriota bacterium]GIU83119.1 MAG: hypothetical protein KatS3mg006_2183 [Pyrinomonadaceae bacterium]
MSVTKWMSWEGGVDLVALSKENIPMPNVIVHFARMVHTPVGSAPSGMILLPDETGAPKVMGFVSTDKTVGDYFGANIFAGTPFENAPTLIGDIQVETDKATASVSVRIDGYEVRLELSELGEINRVSRQSPNLPFHDASLEASAGKVRLVVNGEELAVIVPPVGISGGPAAVFSPAGIYSR